MKHKKQRIILMKLWSFCLGSLCLGACSSSSIEDEGPWTEAEKAPITFGTSLSRAAVNTDTDGTLTGMQDYAVWGWYGYQSDGTLPPSGGEVQIFDQTIVSYPSGMYEGTRYWEMNKTYRFYAVHPAGMKTVPLQFLEPLISSIPIGCQSNGTIWVRGFDASAFGAKAVDFMTGRSEPITTPASGKPAPGPVALSFQHELAKVNFVILGAEADVTVTEVKLLGVGYQGNFITPYTDHTTTWSNIQYTAETDNPATNPYKVGPFKMTPSDSDKNKNIFDGDLLLLPQQLTETSRFIMSWEYKNGGQKRTVQVPFPQAGPDCWERGKSYVYSATIPAYESDITLDVKVQDWNKPIVVDVELN